MRSATLYLVYRAFCEKCNKGRLDHLFGLLFESLLGGDSSSGVPTDKFYDCLPGVRWLDLPTATQASWGFESGNH